MSANAHALMAFADIFIVASFIFARMPVFLVSSDGTQYNMKSADQNKTGMAKWSKDRNNEMEIFTCDLEDEMIMMSFLLNMAA